MGRTTALFGNLLDLNVQSVGEALLSGRQAVLGDGQMWGVESAQHLLPLCVMKTPHSLGIFVVIWRLPAARVSHARSLSFELLG